MDSSAAQEWDADKALESLAEERSTLYASETDTQVCKRLLMENGPIVVQAIVHLALNSQNERVRLDAGKYVCDRVLGRIIDSVPVGDKPGDAFDKVASWLMDEETNTTTSDSKAGAS